MLTARTVSAYKIHQRPCCFEASQKCIVRLVQDEGRRALLAALDIVRLMISHWKGLRSAHSSTKARTHSPMTLRPCAPAAFCRTTRFTSEPFAPHAINAMWSTVSAASGSTAASSFPSAIATGHGTGHGSHQQLPPPSRANQALGDGSSFHK